MGDDSSSSSSSTSGSDGRPVLVNSSSSSSYDSSSTLSDNSTSSSSRPASRKGNRITKRGNSNPAALDAAVPRNNAKRAIRPTPHLAPAHPSGPAALDPDSPPRLSVPWRTVAFFAVLSTIAVVLGLLLSFAFDDVRIESVPCWRWAVLLAAFLVGYFLCAAVVALVVSALGAASALLGHFVRPMTLWLGALAWTVVTLVSYRGILGSDLPDHVAERMDKVLVALIAVCVVFCARSLAVSLFALNMFSHLTQPVREARVIDRFFHWVSAGPAGADKEHARLIRRMVRISSNAYLGALQAITAAATMERLGLASLAPRFPRGTTIDEAVSEEIARLVDNLFALCGARDGDPAPRFGEERLMAAISDKGNAIGGLGTRKARYVYEVLDLEMTDVITRETATEVFEDCAQKRVALVSDIRGHNLIVNIMRDLLGIIAYVISAFLLLGSVGVDLIAILVPASALFFAFAFAFAGPIAEFVRGFIFVFFRRPYELEDWVEVDGKTLVVKSVSVLVTEFATLGGYAVSISNAVLANKALGNMAKSTSVTLAQFYKIKAGITAADIEVIRDSLKDMYEARPKVFYPTSTVLIDAAPNDSQLSLKIVYAIKAKWTQKGIWSQATSQVHLKVIDLLDKRGIDWGVDYKIEQIK